MGEEMMTFKVYETDGTVQIHKASWREILPSGVLLLTTEGEDMVAYAPGQWRKCIQVKDD